ncbi:protein MEMO1-like [Oscarella lobularis]|uniref:protein MEMO1-like n=1 Tax=Oscarella lobularis TaxID=121494 RepID=UPI00331344F5
MASSRRRPTHAGSWYSDSGDALSKELASWLGKADVSRHKPARAIIAPHAGYRYSGACAAYAYKQIDPTRVKRVFILGPSHHAYLPGCALSSAKVYDTPLYPLNVDQQIYAELKTTGLFETMSLDVDEDEHSIEMHLPYVAKVMQSHKGAFTVVPVLVGALDVDGEKKYGAAFSKYLLDPDNLFVISSDFCHWGKRFKFTHYDKSYKHIYQSIEALDRQGMDLIASCDADGFAKYLKQFRNTICGRHPIGVLLRAVQTLKQKDPSTIEISFLKYAQSSQVTDTSDSSVSYASAALSINKQA